MIRIMVIKSGYIKIILVLAMSCFIGGMTFAQKNILLIAVDDLRPVLNCYGESQIKSPHIDALAEEGFVFQNAYCQWSVCGPSRASLLTGLTPDGSGIRNLKTYIRDVHSDIVTLPQFFKNKGYVTAGAGKIFDPRSVDNGHDEISWTIPYISTSSYDYPAEYGDFVSGNSYRVTANTVVECGPEGMGFDAYQDGQICLDGLNKMEQISEMDQPFFLAVGFKKPHIPFIAPKEYWDMYQREDMELEGFQRHALHSPEYAYHNPEPLGYDDIPDIWTYDDVDLGDDLLEPAKQKEIIHGYYACVSYIDDLVGKLLSRLDELEMRENTIIILWGDHGYHLGDHNQWGKHTNFETAVRAPLIILDPSQESGVIMKPVDFIDIYPTLVELAGFEVPETLQGTVLSPLLQGEELGKPYSVTEYRSDGHASYSFRTDRYRFTVWNKDADKRPDVVSWSDDHIFEAELYDYELDPEETENVYALQSYRGVVDSMMNMLRSWWHEQYFFFDSWMNPGYVKDFNFILNNPGFEDNIDQSWEITTKGLFEAHISDIPTSSEGHNSMLVSVSQNGGYDDMQITSDVYHCFNGLRQKKLRVGIDARSTNESSKLRFDLKVIHFDGAEEIMQGSVIGLPDDYAHISDTFILPESTYQWQLIINGGKLAGSVNLDYVTLTLDSGVNHTGVDRHVLSGSLYPNPTSSYIMLPVEFSSGARLKIYDMQGRLLRSSLTDGQQFDLDRLESGNYVLQLEKDRFSLNQKLVIEKL